MVADKYTAGASGFSTHGYFLQFIPATLMAAKRKRWGQPQGRHKKLNKATSPRRDVARRLTQSELLLEAPLDTGSAPEYYEAYLSDLSADNEETLEPGAAGHGIVCVTGTDPKIFVWMRPTEDIVEKFPGSFPATNEYTLDETVRWGFNSEALRKRIEMLDISHYSAWPHLPCGKPLTPEDSLQSSVLGSDVRFTRSSIDRHGKATIRHYLCAVCQEALSVDSYVHCGVCDEVFDRECTMAHSRQPFQLGPGIVCDYNNEAVECPGCNNDADPKKNPIRLLENPAVDEPYTINVNIDIGSLVPKVSVKLMGRCIPRSDFKVLSSMPASTIWISKGKVVTSSDRYTPTREDPEAIMFQPVKKFMFDREFRDEAKKHGISVEKIHKTFFDAILSELLVSHRNFLEIWANRANEDAVSAELILAIARPSGLVREQTPPFLTALWESGDAFGKTLGLRKKLNVRISDLPESEMLLRTLPSEAASEGGLQATIDVGGTTLVSRSKRLCVRCPNNILGLYTIEATPLALT
jgi:hypothetical protein